MNFRFTEIQNLSDIPRNKHLVYALSINGKYIVVGRGKYNRAKVIFDTIDNISYGHIKSLKVRLYHLFSPEPAFKREIIIANSKEQSKEIEKEKHKRIGGNSLEIEKSIQLLLFKNINNTTVELLFRIAISSSYSGLSDLKKWHNHKIISEKDWELISSKLKLPIAIE